MKRTNNFKRLTEEERMDLPPATVYPSDDPRSALAPVEGGYPEDYGLDLRDHQQMPDVPEMDFRDPVTVYATDDSRSRLPPRAGGYPERPRPEPKYGIPEPMLGPSQYGTPQPRERTPIQKLEPINENFERLRIQVPEKVPVRPPPPMARRPQAPADGEVPDSIKGALAGIGGVADRAQARMEADVPRPGSMRGLMASSSQSAAKGAATPQDRKPLVPPNGAAVPPEVAKFASDKMAEDAIAKSNRASMVERGLGGMTENIRAGLDTATRMRTPSYGGAMREDADGIDNQVAAAKEFALKKLGLDRQARQDRLGEEKTRAEIDRMGREGQPKPGADPLDVRHKELTNANLEADLAKKKRPAGGVDPLAREKRELEVKKLRNEVDGTGAVSPKQKQQILEVQERHKNIKDNIKSLRDQIDATGTWEAGGAANADMERKINNIATDMAKLTDPESVAREAEVAGFRRGLFEPGLLSKNSTAKDVLDHFEKEVDQRLENAYRVRGIDPAVAKGGGQAAGQPSERDSQAVAWAKANPNDPRAAKILELNKVR